METGPTAAANGPGSFRTERHADGGATVWIDVAGRPVVPELIQDAFTPEAVAAEALRVLLNRPLAQLDAGTVAAWVKVESKRRPTVTAKSFRLLRAFVNWCAEHDEYRAIVQADASTSTPVRSTSSQMIQASRWERRGRCGAHWTSRAVASSSGTPVPPRRSRSSSGTSIKTSSWMKLTTRNPALRRSRAAKKQQIFVAMPQTTTASMPGRSSHARPGAVIRRDRGPGSLREALFIAAAAHGEATIAVRVPKITLATTLPPLVNPRGVHLKAAAESGVAAEVNGSLGASSRRRNRLGVSGVCATGFQRPSRLAFRG